jgi:uncharacterized repeat protein (TIGR01451 family)
VGDVGITKTLTNESITTNGIAEAGEILTYTIRLSNPTAAPVPGFALLDRLSVGLTYVDSSNGGISLDGKTVNWTNLTVPANNVPLLVTVAGGHRPRHHEEPAGGRGLQLHVIQ